MQSLYDELFLLLF